LLQYFLTNGTWVPKRVGFQYMLCTCIPNFEGHLLEYLIHCCHVSPYSNIVHETCDLFKLHTVPSGTAAQPININAHKLKVTTGQTTTWL